MSRPLGLLIVWHINPENNSWTIMRHGLFPYYQNGVDYLTEYARAKGWKKEETPAFNHMLAYDTPSGHRVELSLVEVTGVDLSKETYLFEETVNEEAKA